MAPFTNSRSTYDGFILTVPHAVPRPESDPDEHWQDFIAEEMARHLECDLSGNVDLVIADVNRSVRDYNRGRTRRNKWRRDLDKRVDQKPRYVLMDVHSFPPDHPDYGGSEVSIISNLPYIQGHEGDFAYYLNQRGVTTFVLTNEVSDIVTHYREKGRRPYMLEFNESMSPARRREVAIIISEYPHFVL